MVESLNRQRVLNFLEVFYTGDVEGALSRCSDDIVVNLEEPPLPSDRACVRPRTDLDNNEASQ